MRFEQPSRPVIDVRTTKEAKLKAFITEAVAAHDGASALTLVARATDSPVACALAAAIAGSGRTDLMLNAVLFDIDSIVEDHASASILDVRGAEFRVLGDARFVAAHEQLVLGGDRVWIGDCMRRDPMKRDAFELFHASNPTCAGHAIASFAKLWEAAHPLDRTIARAPAPEVIAAGQTTEDSGMPTTRN